MAICRSHILGSRFSYSNRPPVIPLVSGLNNRTASFDNVAFQFPTSIQMIVSMEGRLLGAALVALPLHHPRHHYILLVTFVPTASASFLLESPYVHQGFTAHVRIETILRTVSRRRSKRIKNSGNGLNTPGRSGQVVDDSDGNSKVKETGGMRESKVVGNNGSMRLVLARDFDEVR